MQEEERIMEEASKPQGNDTTLEALKKLKENSVSKDEYSKLEEEHKQLLQMYVDGVIPEELKNKATDEPKDLNTLRDELFNRENDNLTYWEKTLELREEVLKQEGKDIFLPQGHDINPSDDDKAKADRVASVVRECIEKADGNSESFTNFLMQRTNDVKIPPRR